MNIGLQFPEFPGPRKLGVPRGGGVSGDLWEFCYRKQKFWEHFVGRRQAAEKLLETLQKPSDRAFLRLPDAFSPSSALIPRDSQCVVSQDPGLKI